MQIQKEINPQKIAIKGYQPGEIKINNQLFTVPIIVTANQVIEFTPVHKFELLQSEHLMALLENNFGDDINQNMDCEMLLLGSGAELAFLPTKVTAPILAKGVGVETMSSRNACHTFQVLSYEQRPLIALLFP